MMNTRALFFYAITLWASIFGMGRLGYMFAEKHYQDQLLSRGLAIYCPDDGRFAFKGECND